MRSWFLHWIPRLILRWHETHRSQAALRALSLRVAEVVRENRWEHYLDIRIGWDAETPTPQELVKALVMLHHQLHGHDIHTSRSLVDRDGESSRFYDEGLGEIVDSLKRTIRERS